MFKNSTTQNHLFLFIVFWLLWAWMMQPLAFAAGRVEHHQITSKILADAGEVANRELSVYVPEDYDTSGLDYLVLYLLHGSTGTNRTFLGAGYAGAMSGIKVNEFVDRLTADGKIKPLIVVLPHDTRGGPEPFAALEDHLDREVIPFVDRAYRTLPKREARAMSGHSRGARISLAFAFSHAERISLIGAYAADLLGNVPGADTVRAHPQNRFPLRFWLYVGSNDSIRRVTYTRNLAGFLQDAGIPVLYVEDDGNHISKIAGALEQNIIWLSTYLSNPTVSVKPKGKLATTWGEIEGIKGGR